MHFFPQFNYNAYLFYGETSVCHLRQQEVWCECLPALLDAPIA